MFLTNGYFSYACSDEYSETEFSKEFSINASVLLKESGASGVCSINDNGATFYSPVLFLHIEVSVVIAEVIAVICEVIRTFLVDKCSGHLFCGKGA